MGGGGEIDSFSCFDQHFHPLKDATCRETKLNLFLNNFAPLTNINFETGLFSLRFPKLWTIRIIPRSRELIIHAIIRVRKQVRSKQHVGLCVDQGVGRLSTNCQSTSDILSLKTYLSNWFFFMFSWKINLSNMQFYFPLITNSNSRRKTGLSCSFVSQTSQLSGIIHSQTLVMNFYSL